MADVDISYAVVRCEEKLEDSVLVPVVCEHERAGAFRVVQCWVFDAGVERVLAKLEIYDCIFAISDDPSHSG